MAIFPLIGGASLAKEGSDDWATVSLRSEVSGWTIPLFIDAGSAEKPVWFALNSETSGFNVHSPDRCPVGLQYLGIPQNLYMADGTNVGTPTVTSSLGTGLQYRDVSGLMGLTPASVLFQRKALYIHGVDDHSFLMQRINRAPIANIPTMDSARDRWQVRGSLMRRKHGRVIEYMPEKSLIEFNLLSDDVTLPASRVAKFAGWRPTWKVDVRENRLYLPCKRFDSKTGKVYDFFLKFGDHEIQIPIKRSAIVPKTSKDDSLCPSNLVFANRDTASIGRSVLDRNDVILDGERAKIIFVPFDSSQRMQLKTRTSFNAPRLLRLQFHRGTEKIFNSQPVRHRIEWTPSNSNLWTQDDFVVRTVVGNKGGFVERIELQCVAECPAVVPDNLENEWYGSARLESGEYGSLILREIMDRSSFKLFVVKGNGVIFLKFNLRGKRFIVDHQQSRDGLMVQLSSVRGPIRDEEEFIVSMPLDDVKIESLSGLPIIPANKDRFKAHVSTIFYGKPAFVASMDEREIRISAFSSQLERQEYSLELKTAEHGMGIQIGAPFNRWRQIVFMPEQYPTLEFRISTGNDQPSNEFALGSLKDAKILGGPNRYVLTVNAIPGTQFAESPFELLPLTTKWIGEPMVVTDSLTKSISIVPGSSETEFDLFTENYGNEAKLFFISSNAIRFTVPRDLEITNGEPLVFPSAEGVPTEGEFILSSTIESSSDGTLTLRFYDVIFPTSVTGSSLVDGPKVGRWIGKPKLDISSEGALVLMRDPRDDAPYKVELSEDFENSQIVFRFIPAPYYRF